jgi:hypothetical protein
LQQWLKDAGFEMLTSQGDKSAMLIKLMHCCCARFPATKPMLPKMLALLQLCKAPGLKSSKLYFYLQKSIENHYRTEGNCFLFGDAKEILSGELDFDKRMN